MKQAILILTAMMLAACATTEEGEVVNERDTVQDFIQMHNLEKVNVIRGFENPGVLYMHNPRYIIAYLRHDQWLLQYAHECRIARLDSGDRPNDKRRYTRALYVRVDTFRGCPVKAMYPITLAHAQELVAMGRGPGDDN
jgi:hypothetical protein